jgi:hypothetical protein
LKSYAALLSFLIFSPQAQAQGWFKNFCAKYIISDNPNEADEIIKETRELYPDQVELRAALNRIYVSESGKDKPNQRLLELIERELE